MPEPYIGEIRMFAGSFAPVGWLFCNGQLIPISENDALFTLIGTTYGGDGQETFALPNLQSRIPIHAGQGPGLQAYPLSQMAGVEEVTLTVQQIPVHSHQPLGSNSLATQTTPGGGMFAQSVANNYAGVSPINLSPQSISPVGGSQPHTNIQPYLCINFIISLFGIFPQQT